MAKKDFWELVSTIGQIVAYVIAIVLILELLKAIFGATWELEEIILALVIFNLTVTFGVGGYLISLNNRISKVNTKVEGHFGWHKGVNNSAKKVEGAC